MKIFFLISMLLFPLSSFSKDSCEPALVFGAFGSSRGFPSPSMSFQDVFNGMEKLRSSTQLKIDQDQLQDQKMDFEKEERLFHRGIRTEAQFLKKKFDLERAVIKLRKTKFLLQKSGLKEKWNQVKSTIDKDRLDEQAMEYSRRYWDLNYQEVSAQKQIFDLEISFLEKKLQSFDHLKSKGIVSEKELKAYRRKLRDIKTRSISELSHLKLINKAGCLEYNLL